MASALVDEALQGLKSLREEDHATYPRCALPIHLEYMREFLLLASKWPNDVRSKSDENTTPISSSLMVISFLNRLEDSLVENGKNFRNLFLAQKNEIGSELWGTSELFQRAHKLNKCISSFSQEIAESFNTLSDYCALRSSDQFLEFVDSVQGYIANVIESLCFSGKDPKEVKSLQEKLLFSKNFIRFLQLRGSEPWQLQYLLAHLQVVAVNAARLCYEWRHLLNNDNEFQLKFSELLLKIKPVDPQIRETYVQVLRASKFSRSSKSLTSGTDRYVLGDFVHSLLYNILEAITDRDSYIVSLEDQVSMVHEGLIFLRTILMNHLEKIDELHEKIKDLIGAAVYEAAIVICSIPVHELEEGLAKEMDFALLNFLEKIKLIKVITSSFIFPRTNERDFVNFFLENLKELPSCKADSIAYAKDQIQTVQEDLASLKLSFLESDVDQRNQDGKLQSLWSRVAEVAYKTRFVIESLVAGDIPDCSTLYFNFITEEINLIRMEALSIDDNQYSSEAQNATKISSPSLSQCSAPTINKMEVTLDDEANTIIGQLIRGSKQLDIISIVGMPGIGKTTLARNVYDDPSVKAHFRARAWCVISQLYEKKDLFLQILRSVDLDFSGDNYSKKNEYELEEKLKKCLLRKRYLIVLDDVWNIDAWSDLVRSFPDDVNSSRILLTSRHSVLAEQINPNREPHHLRLLTVEESWYLLQKKLSCSKSYPLDLGVKIAENCKGLPLTIVIVAGILENLEQDRWAEIAERLSLSDLPIINQCMDMLEVSYKILPENLRSCLLYFGAFREDEEIPCKRLMWLWKAEGFIQKCETESLEDVAKDYMDVLIGRNLIMVSKERSLGGAKTCRIHDLLHEFCVVKAKKENFLSVLSEHDELFSFHCQRNLQRLCIRSFPEDFEKLRLFCPGVRSLLFTDDGGLHFMTFHISFIVHLFKLLKVLDLTNFNLHETFPSEITLVVELRYLAIRGTSISIPPVVANLLDLETLVVYADCVYVPDTIWNLSKLRVLQSSGLICLDSGLMSTNLHTLDTFSTLNVSCGQFEEIIKKLTNIRRLKCHLVEESGESKADCKRIVVLDWLSRLESLNVYARDNNHIGFRFPRNIKKLSVSGFYQTIIPKRGELPNLVVLKLRRIRFDGGTWDMNEEWEFPKLKLLEIEFLNIVRWIGSDGVDHFPCLEKLAVHYCQELKEVPSCLGDIPTLQMIEVFGCGESAASLFQKTKEEQKDWGNDIQVLIKNTEYESSEDAEDESSEDVEDEITAEEE